jgi:hypothetical protein
MAIRTVVNCSRTPVMSGWPRKGRSHAIVGPVTEAHQVDAKGLLRVLAGLGDVVADCFEFAVQAA